MMLHGSLPDVEALTLFLGRSYCAYPEGSSELVAAQGRKETEAPNGEHNFPQGKDTNKEQRVPREVQPSGTRTSEKTPTDSRGPNDPDKGEKGVRTEGDGHQDTRVSRIWQALTQLDMMNDKHWTAERQPAVAAVEDILGEPVTRAEISAVAPDFNRQPRVAEGKE